MRDTVTGSHRNGWWRVRYLALTGVLGLLLMLHSQWLTGLAQFLERDDPLEPADVVVVLGGGGTHRVAHGIDLLRRGYARQSKLIITGGRLDDNVFTEGTWAAMGRNYALSKGVMPENIILADETESTFDDAQAARAIMEKEGFRSAIVVSDPFHMRRAMWVFQKVFRDSNMRVIASAAREGWFNTAGWWTRERELLAVGEEFFKMGFYLLKYGL